MIYQSSLQKTSGSKIIAAGFVSGTFRKLSKRERGMLELGVRCHDKSKSQVLVAPDECGTVDKQMLSQSVPQHHRTLDQMRWHR